MSSNPPSSNYAQTKYDAAGYSTTGTGREPSSSSGYYNIDYPFPAPNPANTTTYYAAPNITTSNTGYESYDYAPYTTSYYYQYPTTTGTSTTSTPTVLEAPPTLTTSIHSSLTHLKTVNPPISVPNHSNKDLTHTLNYNDLGKQTGAAQKKKQKTIVRAAGGEVWEDPTLLEWDTNDFRLFCGDLGNEVTDDVLYKAFGKYPSLQKAKVVRDKRTGKSKGYGFVSFKDADEFVKAWKEMNGKYVGNRPIKLRKSTWKDRNIEARIFHLWVIIANP
ncbi:hypothetical protein G9A89_013422 [Geosiphon pyriformis]|nr:hypothetical protein G9A89_013422 [Geosiphon pyriformis]